MAGPILRQGNDGAGERATALELQVGLGKAPLRINEGAGTATNLSADRLDGKDSTRFVTDDIYYRYESFEGRPDATAGGRVACDEGDMAIGGNYIVRPSSEEVEVYGAGTSPSLTSFFVYWESEGRLGTSAQVFVTCADLGEPRSER